MEYLDAMLVLIGIYVILASSFNLILGFGGLISIAHPVFYAVGAYASAILARDHGVPVPVAMLAGGVTALVVSAALALPALRVSGDYLLIASIGFQLGILEIVKNVGWTGGAGGMTNIPSLLIHSAGRGYYVVLVLLAAAGTALFVRWLARSAYGRALSALRDDELACASLGRDALPVKVSVFAVGSGLAGFAGALYAHYFRFLSPDQFEILQSAAILTMVVVGGMRTIWGPIVGAVLLEALPQAITFLNMPPSILGPVQGLLFTGLVLVFMFVRPQGIVPARDFWRGNDVADRPNGARHARRA